MRNVLLEKLYKWSIVPYRLLFKKEAAWDITSKQLLNYPEESLGFHLGCFLITYDFTPEPQLENHDVFHVLTNSGVSVPQEIAMQFYLFGNGKRSLYLFIVLAIGSMLFIEYWSSFYKSYRLGKQAHPFYNLTFQKLLDQPLQKLQQTFNIQSL